jgi:hypothetical protein
MKDVLQPLVNQFMPFAQKRMGFHKPPRIFLRDDPENAQNPLGKTAYYDPAQMSVTLYINGRHPKDVMRSLSHELVHHTQNCNGQFDDAPEMGEGYAQNDAHLREMERQAYEQGNLCFRDWEDSIKGTIYIQNLNVNIQKEGKFNMSTKDWKNRELPSLLTEKWGFSFNMLTESQEEVVEEAEEEVVEEGMCGTCGKSPCCCPAMEEGVFKGRTGDDEDLPNSVAAAKKKRRDDVYKDSVKGYYGKDYRKHLEEETDERFMPPECRSGGAKEGSQECIRAAMMAQGLYAESEDAIEAEPVAEGGAAARTGNEEKDQGRDRMHADRLHEEELDEEAKKMIKCGDKGMMPDYACDGEGQNDQREKMDEAQIRQLIRKLVKEAMNRKETK